jgi:hypothetical protein
MRVARFPSTAQTPLAAQTSLICRTPLTARAINDPELTIRPVALRRVAVDVLRSDFVGIEQRTGQRVKLPIGPPVVKEAGSKLKAQ